MDMHVEHPMLDSSLSETSKLKSALSWIVNYLPTAAVVGLIALYYVQLSHLG